MRAGTQLTEQLTVLCTAFPKRSARYAACGFATTEAPSMPLHSPALGHALQRSDHACPRLLSFCLQLEIPPSPDRPAPLACLQVHRAHGGGRCILRRGVFC